MLQFEDAIQALADALHLPGLRAQQEGLCQLRIGGLDFALAHYPGLHGVALRVCVGHIANDRFAHWLEVLASANLFGDGPTGSVLGLEPDGSVFLTQFIPQRGIETGTFLRICSGFIGRAFDWAGRLQDAASSPLAHLYPPSGIDPMQLGVSTQKLLPAEQRA